MLKCYSSFSQMKNYYTLFSPILNYFWLAYLSLFFFFLSFCQISFSLFKFFFSFFSLCSPSILHRFPLFFVDFGNRLEFIGWKWAWWRGGWKLVWVFFWFWKRAWVCQLEKGLVAWWLKTGLGLPILAWACRSRFGCADLGEVVCRSRPGLLFAAWWSGGCH